MNRHLMNQCALPILSRATAAYVTDLLQHGYLAGTPDEVAPMGWVVQTIFEAAEESGFRRNPEAAVAVQAAAYAAYTIWAMNGQPRQDAAATARATTIRTVRASEDFLHGQPIPDTYIAQEIDHLEARRNEAYSDPLTY